MLDTLLKFGSYRVDYFEPTGSAPFAFYIRGCMSGEKKYSQDAKHQLYWGLAMIQKHLGLSNLAAVYLDINDQESLDCQAYKLLKQDLTQGLFKRVYVADDSVFEGCSAARLDLVKMQEQTGDFELFTLYEGQVVNLFQPVYPVIF